MAEKMVLSDIIYCVRTGVPYFCGRLAGLCGGPGTGEGMVQRVGDGKRVTGGGAGRVTAA